jgi:hypothetical protein
MDLYLYQKTLQRDPYHEQDEIVSTSLFNNLIMQAAELNAYLSKSRSLSPQTLNFVLCHIYRHARVAGPVLFNALGYLLSAALYSNPQVTAATMLQGPDVYLDGLEKSISVDRHAPAFIRECIAQIIEFVDLHLSSWDQCRILVGLFNVIADKYPIVFSLDAFTLWIDRYGFF